MTSEARLKVCVVAISLGRGGAERATALLTQMLDSRNFDVHIVILNDLIQYSFSGKLLNLGRSKTLNDSLIKKICRFRKFRNYLKQHRFDAIIDTRSRPSALKEWFYLNYIYRSFSPIYVVHSSNLSQYFTTNDKLAKQMLKRSRAVVGVSEYITKATNQKYNSDKAITIYNPIVLLSDFQTNAISKKYVLYLGRLDEKVKNLSLLLNSYKKSTLPNKGVRLKIVGEGPDESNIKKIASDLGLGEITDFLSFTPDVVPLLKSAFFTVLTSRYEGFPMVLIESLAVGTPVVSVDCVSGPNEIITHEKNGLLVENHNPEKLGKAFDRMLSEPELYKKLKLYAVDSVAHLSFDEIAAQWNKLLRNERN